LLVQKENITTIIPHRAPVLMIDHLLEQDDIYTHTNFSIVEENIFVKNGVLQEAGIIENIAQSAAAGAGYHHLQAQTAQPITFIASIQQLQIIQYPPVGSLIHTQIKLVDTVMNFNIVEGKCFLEDELVAGCEMKVMMEMNPV
jgi:predicted hotdog family 3-hydroxylacyl-ACP dehydratase